MRVGAGGVKTLRQNSEISQRQLQRTPETRPIFRQHRPKAVLLVLPPETARDPIPGPAKRIKEEWRNDSVGGVTKNVPLDLPTGRKLAWKVLALKQPAKVGLLLSR